MRDKIPPSDQVYHNKGNKPETEDKQRADKITNLMSIEELQAELDFINAALDSQQDTFFIFDIQTGKAVKWNKAFREISGYSDDEISKLIAPKDYYSAEDLKRLDPIMDEIAKKGQVKIELSLITKNGRKIPTEYIAKVISDREGNPFYLISIGRDIRDRRQAEEKFKNIIESSPMGIHMYSLDSDDNLIFIGANPAADNLLGVDNSKFLGLPINEAFPPLMETEIPSRYMAAAKDGIPWQTEQIYYEHDKIKGAFMVHAFQTYPGQMAALFLDITRRKQMEEELRESRERYSELVNLLPLIVYEMDISGKLTFVNRKAFESFGYTVEDFERGISGFEMIIPEDRKRARQNTELRLRSGEAGFEEYTAIRKNGEHFNVEIHSNLIYQNNAPMGLRGIIIDITDRKQLEDQLRQSQKMEAVGQLAGGIAHDFNNLLQAINGYTEFAMDEISRKDSCADSLKQISKATNKAINLTSQLLAFSRRQILDMKTINLNTVIENLLKMIKVLIGEHIILDFIPVSDLESVRADIGQIEQIIMNICINARDAMPGGGRITLETRNRRIDEEYCKDHSWAVPGEYIQLNITDNGFGMDSETQAHIFEPFFTTKEFGEGTGLGLATVYGIIKQHSGMVNVYSEPGKGTMFTIYLPKAHSSPTTVEIEPEAPPVGGSETILLAEDDDDVCKLVKNILENAGYKVLAVTNGEEALKTYKEQQDGIDLLLLDVVMPKMGGYDVYCKIREKQPDIRALFSSGYSSNAIHTNFILDEDLNLIQKPYDRNALLRKIRRILDN